jgi:hypothetical protein
MQQQFGAEHTSMNQRLTLLFQSVAALHSKLTPARAQQHEHRHQRACIAAEQIPVLARDEILDTIFQFVGVGDYYYVAGVCRNWRGRYMTLCRNTLHWRTKIARPRYTSCMSIVATAARLQIALDNGLTIEKLAQVGYRLASSIVATSLEPKQVLMLARLYGMQWTNDLTGLAAFYAKYELLKWLHSCGCPWDLEGIIDDMLDNLFETDDLEHIEQLYSITCPWPADRFTDVLLQAARYNSLDTVKWCREQRAEWPERSRYATEGEIWSLRCVEWAIANGSTWLTWRCQDLAPEHYNCPCAEHSDESCTSLCDRKIAAEVFEWAHENGCPCTCGEAAAV